MKLSWVLVLSVLVTATQTKKLLPESAAERPALSDATHEDLQGTSAVGDTSVKAEGRAPRRVEKWARQGVPGGGRNMFTQTLNALNPVPYLLGGLNGVRQVMQQRLQPLQGIIMRNAPRPSNFRGSPNFFNSGGGGFSSSGGGERHAIGGGSRYAGNGMDVVAAGPKHIESVDERLTRGTHNQFHPSDSTAEAFKSVFQSTRRPLTDSNSDPLQTVNFGPPKPISVMGDGSPAPHLSTGNPHTLSQPYSEAISGPNDSSTPDVVHELKPQNKYTRIINIHVPEEMQNLTILEINMKANGDISIGGSSGKNTSSPPANLPTSHISSPLPPALISSPPSPLLSPLSSSAPIDHLEIFYPQYPPFPPGVGDIFSEDQRLHELAFDTNPEDFEVHTNPEGLSFDGTNSQDLTPARPMSVNSHDIFRMQPLVNTNTALRYNLPVEWRSLNNLQPNLENDHIDANNEHIPVELPVSLLRNKHVPKFSRQFPPEKSNPNQIYFVPVNMPSATSESLPPVQNRPLFARQNRPTSDIHSRPSFSIQNRPVSDIQSRPSFASQSQRSQPDSQGSPMYYIDITIPGERGVPIVNAKRFTRYKRSLQFDGWYPMDVSNPMADDPTVGYQPPPLQRVHFSNEPVPKKPLYPVRPENPTVFVVRAEPRHPEYHSVYGTENIEYFHVHPQTNIVRAFRAPSQSVGAIRFVPAPQFGDLRPSSRSTSDADTLEDSSKKHGNDTHLNIDFSYQDVPAKDAGFADKLDAFDANGSSRFPEESPRLDADNDYDMEGAYSEIRSTIVERPSHVLPFSRRDRIPGSSKQQNAHSYRYRPDPPTRDRRPNQQRDQELKTTRPALHELLGNLPQETQIEEIPYVGSATDSAGVSFIRKIPPPDFRYSSRGSNKQRQSLNNTRSHPRGTQVRQAAGNFTQTFSRPWFLIDTRSEVSDRKREPSIASYIHPETRSDDKIHYKPLGPISYVSKEGDKTASEHIHNPHLDDHMNSYKPTLTANSLSELLQIFRFTQVTDGPDSEDATDEPVTIPREFRYTRPTEEPPITTTTTVTSSTQSTTHRSNIHSKNFQTSTTPRYNDTTTEAEDTKKTQGGDFDAVADTNSLDGYLFSDSEASPEYAHPQVRPNVVTTKVKDEVTTKGVTKETSRVSVQTSTNSHVFQESSEPKETFKGLEIIYPGQSSRRTPEASWPLYIIHQGHSKVRVFGINSAEDKKLGNPDYRELFVLSTLEPRASSPVPFTRNATTNEIPATASTSTSPTGTTIPFTSSFTILDTSPTTTSVTNPPTSSAAATTSVPQPTSRTPSFPIEQNRTTSIPTDKMTTTPPSTPVETTTILSNTPVETTTMPPSASVKTTTVLPSTLIETTTSPPTTLIETTTSPPATLFETTTSPPSTSVETTATPDSTLDETTTTHPNAPTTNEDLVPANETAGEYEYYYTDEEYSIPELAFGEDDKSEDSARPALMLPDPTPLPVEEMPDALASATSFSRFLQDRLSRVKSLLQQGGLHQQEPEDAVPLASATGLTRPERSVGRPVFFIKRLAEATEEASLTQPSGYLSQLRSEKRTPLTDTEDTPRMKRVTEAATEA